eukprot:gene28029-36933_t
MQNTKSSSIKVPTPVKDSTTSIISIIETRNRKAKIPYTPEAYMMSTSIIQSHPPDTFILDCGSTNTILAKDTYLDKETLQEVDNGFILLGGKQAAKIPISHKGTIGPLKDIMVVKTTERNLIATAQLVELGYSFRSTLIPKHAFIIAAPDGVDLAHCVYHHGLYHFTEADWLLIVAHLKINAHPTVPNPKLTPSQIKGSSPTKSIKSHINMTNKLQLISNRCCGATKQTILNMAKHHSVIGLGHTYDELKNLHIPYNDFQMLGNMKNSSHPSSKHLTTFSTETNQIITAPPSSKILPKFHVTFSKPDTEVHLTTAPLEKIHTDPIGKFSKSRQGNYYALIILDDYSNWGSAKFFKTKDEVLTKLELYRLEHAGINSMHKIRIIQTDFDILFRSYDYNGWLLLHDIKPQYSAPYVKQQNGKIERYIQTITATTRSIMGSKHLPNHLWEDVITTVIYVKNRINCSAIPVDKTPYELFHGIRPDISHFVPIGSPGWVHIYDDEPRSNKIPKFQPHNERCIVLGYAEHTKNAYNILTESGQYKIRGDVRVDEHQPFDQLPSSIPSPSVIPYEINIEEELSKGPLTFSDDHQNFMKSAYPQLQSIPHIKQKFQPIIQTRAQRKKELDQQLIDDQEAELNYTINSYNAFMSLEDTFSADPPILVNPQLPSIPKLPRIYSRPNSDLPPVPINYKQAVSPITKYHQYWIESIYEELQQFYDREIFRDLDPNEPLQEPTFDSKFAFRITRDIENFLKFKARLVARGFKEIYGIHYDKTFSPTVHYESIRLILHIAKILCWYLRQIDIGNAYLEAQADRRLLMELPRDWSNGKLIIVELIRNIYGLKQAGLLWYLMINDILLEYGFERTIHDPCVYIKPNPDFDPLAPTSYSTLIITMFVDDQLIAGCTKKLTDDFVNHLLTKFRKITDFGELQKYVGVTSLSDSTTNHLNSTMDDLLNIYIAKHVPDM